MGSHDTKIPANATDNKIEVILLIMICFLMVNTIIIFTYKYKKSANFRHTLSGLTTSRKYYM